MKCSEGLVAMNNRSSSVCVDGRARQLEFAGGARLFEVQCRARHCVGRSLFVCVEGRARQ